MPVTVPSLRVTVGPDYVTFSEMQRLYSAFFGLFDEMRILREDREDGEDSVVEKKLTLFPSCRVSGQRESWEPTASQHRLLLRMEG